MTDSNAEHRLFHVLVLMGGGLALSCGGAVSVQGNPDGAGAAAAPDQQGTASAVSSGGGTAVAGASWATPGAATSTGGAGFSSAGAGSEGEASRSGVDAGAPSLPCSPEQWDCTAVLSRCGGQLLGADLPAGCVCAPQRPQSAADCSANESLLCVRAYQPATGSYLRIQCACVATSDTDSPSRCMDYCDMNWHNDPTTFPPAACLSPLSTTCTEQGVCTATAADVLRQEGILCGCADIGLK